jgi:hypothetical protein
MIFRDLRDARRILVLGFAALARRVDLACDILQGTGLGIADLAHTDTGLRIGLRMNRIPVASRLRMNRIPVASRLRSESTS